MEYVRLGSSGLRVSRIGLGMMSYGDPAAVPWYLDEAAAEPIVRRAVDGGVTFFDTADMYSDGASEEITGSLLRKLFADRDDYVLATKVYYPTGAGPNDRGLSRKHIMAAVDASLRRLGTDHIDLYQVHRWDDTTPIAETMDTLQDLVRVGKVRYLGASLMRAWQFATAQATGPGRFVSMQTRYNLVYREEEREMLPLCAHQGVGVLPYSPLARGLLARGLLTRGPASSGPLTDGPDSGPALPGDSLSSDRLSGSPLAGDPLAGDPLSSRPASGGPASRGRASRGPASGDPVARDRVGGDASTGGGATARSVADQSARSRSTDSDADVVDALHTVAAARGLPPAQIALAWLLSKPAVTAPIIGATKPRHLDDALAAVDLRLTDAEIAAVEAPYQPHEPYGYT